MSSKARAVCAAKIGRRQNHEDNFLFDGVVLSLRDSADMADGRQLALVEKGCPRVRLYAVSDGMGGHRAGEAASLLCVQELRQAAHAVQGLEDLDAVVEVLQRTVGGINARVCAESRRDESLRGMGATLVLLAMLDGEQAILNVGDSRAYWFDGRRLTQITKDQTEGQRMLDLGLLTRRELADFPASRHLSRYIGCGAPGFVLRAEETRLRAEEGVLLLCSDGLTDALTVEEIAAVLAGAQSPEDAAGLLVERAAAAEQADNVTVILAPAAPPAPEPEPDPPTPFARLRAALGRRKNDG